MPTSTVLVAVLGGGITQAHVLSHVVGRQAECAVSGLLGHGERPVRIRRHDVPDVAVADRLPGGGAQLSVVAAGDDHIAQMRVFDPADPSATIRSEFAEAEA